MALYVNSRRRRGAAARVAEFMPVWPLARPPRPTVAQLTARLEAWLGIHHATLALARGAPAGGAAPAAARQVREGGGGAAG